MSKNCLSCYVHKPSNSTKIVIDIDVFFFGKVNKDRKIFLDYLTNNGINLKVVGNNYENNFFLKSIKNIFKNV